LKALSVASNSALILRAFPSFREVFDAGFAGCWEGDLAPNSRSYRVSIFYMPTYLFDCGALQYSSMSVRIVSPLVSLDPKGTGERPPHIYVDPDDLGFRLCLFDPRKDEWSSADAIAETIIPWAAEWLFWFEVWMLTGVWSGGGSHPEMRDIECHTNSPSYPALPVRFLDAVSRRIGREIGTSASFQLMAAASEASFQPLYLRISKQPSALVLPSPTTSISPPALRLAESSLWV
jgi:hypothetical protein